MILVAGYLILDKSHEGHFSRYVLIKESVSSIQASDNMDLMYNPF
jgi:hypothetical protein